MPRKPLPVVIEIAKGKAFASALPWPGWCRAGRTEEAALATLAEYASRYAPVAALAGMAFADEVADTVEVLERSPGDATTAFGAPSMTAEAETVRLTAAPARRLADLVAAAWTYFDQTVAQTPQQLRKGPRGGGRDRDKMVDHVLGAEVAYARRIGVKLRQPAYADSVAVDELRQAILAVIGAPSPAGPVSERGWTTAYAARRIAWHVLDHVWEMQDRTE